MGLKLRTTFFLLLLGSLLVACYSKPAPDSCVPDCDGRLCGEDGCGGSYGECVAPLTCTPAGQCQGHARMGEACRASEECESGLCVQFGGGEGYCSLLDCQGPADCVNQAAGEDALMCCAPGDGLGSWCEKIMPGFACGDQDKTCGGSCEGQGDSACAPGHRCLYTDCGVCSHPCETQQDCLDCNSSPDAAFMCVLIGGGESFCLTLSDNTCTASSQCCLGDVCSVYIDETGNALQGYCGSRGTLATGAACDPDDDQCKGMCLEGHCSEACETDADCPGQTTCRGFTFCKVQEGTGECAVCTETFDEVRMCLWTPVGTQPAGAPCASGAIHAGAGDCMAGLTCVAFDATDAPCATVADCAAVFEGNAECVPGTCGDPDHCAASMCIPPCVVGRCEDCFVAVLGDPEGCFCSPEFTSGAPGDPCPFGLVNSEFCHGSCEAGMTCLGTLPDPQGPACADDVDCRDALGEIYNPECVGGRCGTSYCATTCHEGVCDSGFEPFDENGTCYCRPSP